MRVGVTDTLKPSLANYTDWLCGARPDLELVVLSHICGNVEAVDSIDGLLLTGGGDVDPKYYGAADPMNWAKEVNASRDEFEFYVIERALDRQLPILGICRGMQVMNVYLGGTLLLDLPSAGFEDHARRESQVAHTVSVEPGSLLSVISGCDRLEVNSSHHQAVAQAGKGLLISARSPDGVIEGAEWIMKDRMPFLQLVQWHPERMDTANHFPASGALADRFLKEVSLFFESTSSANEHHFLEQ